MVRLKALSNIFFTLAAIFQFLMVRLKEKFNASTQKFNMSFQFLMVRLKASVKGFCFLAVAVFQFLMVRLKEFVHKPHQVLKRYFNSLWCD